MVAVRAAIREISKTAIVWALTHVVQPGGSMRDKDAVDCCNEYGVSFLFTAVRHFRH